MRGHAGGAARHWEPGTQILWRYRENGGARIHIARPVTVVRDDSEGGGWLVQRLAP